MTYCLLIADFSCLHTGWKLKIELIYTSLWFTHDPREVAVLRIAKTDCFLFADEPVAVNDLTPPPTILGSYLPRVLSSLPSIFPHFHSYTQYFPKVRQCDCVSWCHLWPWHRNLVKLPHSWAHVVIISFTNLIKKTRANNIKAFESEDSNWATSFPAANLSTRAI